MLYTHQIGSDCKKISDQKLECDGKAKLVFTYDRYFVWKVYWMEHLGVTVPTSETFFGRELSMTLFFGTCMQCDGISIEGWKYTSICIVAYIHWKILKTHNYDYQNLLQTRFWCWKATHVVNIGVVFWKVDSEAHLVITVPSSETFLVENYSRCRILQLDTARRDLTWGIQIHQQM